MKNKKLAIQWFIEQHADWEKLLGEYAGKTCAALASKFVKAIIVGK